MPSFKLRPRRQKAKADKVKKKEMEAIIHQELAPYITREELHEYLRKIEQDKKKKQLWDSLSMRKKIKVLKYAKEKKGESDGKK